MKLFIGVGIDRYNTGITPLCGAANDVRYLGMVFEQLGFERVILTDEDMRTGRSVSSTLEEQVRRLGDGDLLVFFFAGHGKTVMSPQPDQLLLLHDVTRRSLDAGFTNNTLNLRQIALETSQPGLQRVLIIDACRMPIEQEKADTGAAHGFAVDRNRPAQIRDETAYPQAEATCKLFQVKQSEDSQKAIFRGNAVLEHEELSQLGGVRRRPGGHVFNRVAVRKYRRDRHYQQFQEVMPRAIARLARVVHVAQHLHQSRSSRHLLDCPKDESRRDFSIVYKGLS